MAISAQKKGSQIAIGGDLDQSQIKALSGISVSASEVLSNLEDLNEEIVESGYSVESNTEENVLPDPRPTQAKQPKMGKKARNKRIKRKVPANLPPKKTETPTMDLDQELEAASAELEAREKPVEENEFTGEDAMRDQIMEVLRNTKGAPGEGQIAAWKSQYGEKNVHVMAFGEGDVYIFTHLKRGQWKKIQELMQKAQEQGATDVEDSLKEKVISYCTLWPKPLPIEFFYNSKAGVVDSLYQVILLNSYFLSPQQAMMLTTQL